MPDLKARANQIFISYRRADNAAITGRIYDHLAQEFGRSAVFKDVDSIPLGVNFRKHLDLIISECAVVLVVIGGRWAEGLDDPEDLVRIEIESALRRDIPIIPLLMQNAALPRGGDLPQSLRELPNRQGMLIGDDPRFHSDIRRLVAELESILYGRLRRALRHFYFSHGNLIWVVVGCLLMTMIFWGYWLAYRLFNLPDMKLLFP